MKKVEGGLEGLLALSKGGDGRQFRVNLVLVYNLGKTAEYEARRLMLFQDRKE